MLPHISYRCATAAFQARLDDLLSKRSWDAVIVDGLSTGWAVASFTRHHSGAARRPKLVYLSHNNEAETRRAVARNYRGNPLAKTAIVADAHKAARLERSITAVADLVTAITEDDARAFERHRGGRPVAVLTPGYSGRRVPERQITDDTPRRAVIVGSFEWIAKQMNLREFAEAACPMLREAGMQLEVVGGGSEGFFRELAGRCPGIEIRGRVPSVYPFMDGARIAVLPERSGGGFKLKALDYVFNRLPVAALTQSFAGMPLQDRHSLLEFATVADMARGIVAAMDDLPLLNRIQQRAYEACATRFDWRTRGHALREAIVST